jgi:hypothetical protein
VIKTYSQNSKPTVLKATITTVGSTSVYSVSNNKSYEIQQSIGQSSIIGTKQITETNVQQGFLTNTKSFTVNNSNTDIIDESLELVISPNPFIDHIKIKFSKETKHDIHLIIYDTNGKVFFSEKYKPTDQLIVPMKFYSLGTYLVRIQSGNNKFTKKILKTELDD